MPLRRKVFGVIFFILVAAYMVLAGYGISAIKWDV